MSPLAILQWNCRGIYRKLPEFKHYLYTLQPLPDVLVLQETHLIPKYTPNLPGYQLFRKDRTLYSGGVACFVRNSLTSHVRNVKSPSEIDILCITVSGLEICNVYIPPSSQARDLTFIDTFRSRSLIFGDFNAHHISWSHENNARGICLSEAIDKNNLIILNSSVPTRINIASNAIFRSSLLDLTLASSDIATRCHTVVSDELIGSDHYIILTNIDQKVVKSHPKPRNWSLGKANWAKFSRLVDENFDSIGRTENRTPDSLNETVTNILISASRHAIPLSKNSGKLPTPWWNAECDRAVRRKKAAYLKMKRSFSIADIVRFKKLKSECRRTILTAKRECWETYCSSLNKHSNISKVWSVVRSLSGFSSFKPLPTLVSSNATVRSDKAKADVLSETFAAVSKTDNYSDAFLQHRASVENRYLQSLELHNETEDFNRPFTMAELTAAIQSRPNSSPGQDTVCYMMLKNLSKQALPRILGLYNTSRSDGTLPNAWKYAIVIPLLKDKNPEFPGVIPSYFSH